mgnify:CR=1 FL=1
MQRQTRITITSILFLIVVVLHIYGLIDKEILAFFTKPLLMVTLVLVYLVSVKRPNFWYVSALFFSFWGDVFLLFKDEFFLFGLASFLLAHILFIKISAGFLKKISMQKVVLISLPFVLYLLGLLYIIEENLGEMLIPVLFYGVTISCFGIVTLLNYIQEKTTENMWLFLGAFIFIISDSLIAINKFHEPKVIYSISIMLTYTVAQYLICKAVIVKESKK